MAETLAGPIMDETPVAFTGGALRSVNFDDIYFSVADGLEESRHVFLAGNGFPKAWEGRSSFRVAETGFGTGLNFLALVDLWQNTPEKPELHYFSLEKYPLSLEVLTQALEVLQDRLDPAPLLEVYHPQGGSWVLPGTNGKIHLTLLVGEAADRIAEIPPGIEAWFLDGFAPSKNPDMWSETLLNAVAEKTACHGTLASFTAAGMVKSRLRAAGFDIRRRPGYGNKRHMISGILCAPRCP